MVGRYAPTAAKEGAPAPRSLDPDKATMRAGMMPSMRDWSGEYLGRDDWVEVERYGVTVAGERFLRQHTFDMQYLTADIQLLEILDDAADAVDTALSEGHPRPLTPMRNRLGKYRLRERVAAADRVRGEIALTRYVDSYLTYISDLLREIFIARPEVLRSREQLTVEEALSYTSMEELTAYVADRKVTRLSFQGLGDLTSYFQKSLRLGLVDDPQLREHMAEWVALRNLLTHRRGIVDQRSLAGGLPCEEYKLGEHVRISPSGGFRLIAGVVIAVLDLDERAAEKFGLDRKTFVLHREGADTPNDGAEA